MLQGGKRKEGVLLVAVIFIGVAGLCILQFARSGSGRADERALVQGADARTGATTANGAQSAPLQQIPGNLIRENEQPEAGKPFLFEMANFSQGAVYELDLGDGNYKSFTNGVLQHVYVKPGVYEVTLYAVFEGQKVKLQTTRKQAANTVRNERRNNVEIVPIVDY